MDLIFGLFLNGGMGEGAAKGEGYPLSLMKLMRHVHFMNKSIY